MRCSIDTVGFVSNSRNLLFAKACQMRGGRLIDRRPEFMRAHL